MSTTVATEIPTGTWSIDPVHSSIGFGVKHFGVSTFRGSFKAAAGTLVTEGGALRSVEGTVLVENLVTEEPQLTGHLASEDFFDAAKHPEITFRSTSVETLEGDKLRISGDLTIRGVTKSATLLVNGPTAPQKAPWGTVARGVSATGRVNRKDWGLNWNAVIEAGGFVVGDDVELTFEAELVPVKAQEAPAAH